MSLLDKLERRIGFVAVPGLLRYIAILTAMVFVLYKLDASYLGLIDLDRNAIFRGQVWRLVTYIFVPQLGGFPFPDWINVAFYVLLLWWIGNGLEEVWGAFRLSLFYFVGMIGTTVAALLFGRQFFQYHADARLSSLPSPISFPDTIIYFAYILPLKVKWIAWLSAAFLLLKFFVSSISYQAAFIAAMSNYLLFFGPEIYQAARHRRDVSERRRRFESSSREAENEPLHKCAVCGATELSDANLEFRVARDGEEYCLDHLPKPANAGCLGGTSKSYIPVDARLA